MFSLGWMEIAMIMTAFTMVLVWIVVIVSILANRRDHREGASAPAAYSPSVSADAFGQDSVHVVARLTRRFCPQCRAPLALDAPEQLCPACLMAAGLSSAAALDPARGTAATTPPSGSQPPTAGEWTDLAQHFPQLEILELLGRGGMGAVYKARQKNLDRLVALKVIPPEAAKDPTFAERFAREARALARLNHPNIVTVFDFGQAGDVYWLLMEYVDGVNLRHALRAGHLAPSEALAIVPQICDALQYAHDQGVVHRDIKPENVLLDRAGRVKIADFGLAKMLGVGPDDFALTHSQQVMGTPRYMAPEQIERPSAVDHRADIYSLGVVFYEMLTGELPLGRFQPPSEKVQLDVRIDQVVLRALEKEPERRYQRASQVKTDLASSAPPTWHTPAPATKSSPSEFPAGADLLAAVTSAGTWLRRVARSRHDVYLGGVCGGLGEATPLPAWCWRILFLLSLVGYGIGFIVYLVLWFCLPNAAAGPISPPVLGPITAWLRRMSRSSSDAVLGGVCGGLGENTPLPAWVWRVLFVLLVLFKGFGVIPYLILWICLPSRKAQPSDLPAQATSAPDDRPAWQTPAPAAKSLPAAGPPYVLAASIAALLIVASICAGLPLLYFLSRAAYSPQMPAQMDVASTLPAEAESEASDRRAGTEFSKQDFDRMFKSFRSHSLDHEKLSFLKLAGNHRVFTTEQARQLLSEFAFDEDRAKAAVLLYPRLKDPENFYQALEVFAFDAGRQSVRKQLNLD